LVTSWHTCGPRSCCSSGGLVHHLLLHGHLLGKHGLILLIHLLMDGHLLVDQLILLLEIHLHASFVTCSSLTCWHLSHHRWHHTHHWESTCKWILGCLSIGCINICHGRWLCDGRGFGLSWWLSNSWRLGKSWGFGDNRWCCFSFFLLSQFFLPLLLSCLLLPFLSLTILFLLLDFFLSFSLLSFPLFSISSSFSCFLLCLSQS
jgi:hypothetical protein